MRRTVSRTDSGRWAKYQTLYLRRLPLRGSRSVAVTDTGGMGQKITNRDLPRRRHHLYGSIVARDRHRGGFEFRQIAAHRIRDQQSPLFLQQHHRDADHRLGLRRDSENRVLSHGLRGLPVSRAVGRVQHHPAIPSDEQDSACELPARHIVIEQCRCKAQTFARHAHLLRASGAEIRSSGRQCRK